MNEIVSKFLNALPYIGKQTGEGFCTEEKKTELLDSRTMAGTKQWRTTKSTTDCNCTNLVAFFVRLYSHNVLFAEFNCIGCLVFPT